VRLCQSVQIDFITPTSLKYQGESVEIPEFHQLIKRLRDRVNALGWFYNDCTLDLDYSAFGARSESVRMMESRVKWIDRERFSTKTRQNYSIGGFVGHATYAGDISEFLPLLRVGELVHVGKHAVWGNGQIRVHPLD
jgi:CRISPR/Cas system endoribonuclease Cas6 (RAMP superfamily)